MSKLILERRKENIREIKYGIFRVKTIRRKMVEINKTSKVLFSGPVSSMVACWRNALLLVRRSYRISKDSRISLRNLQHNTRDINAVNDLELGQGVKFIIIELCFEK